MSSKTKFASLAPIGSGQTPETAPLIFAAPQALAAGGKHQGNISKTVDGLLATGALFGIVLLSSFAFGGAAEAQSLGDTLQTGCKLQVGQSLTSANGMYTLRVQEDGNCVLEGNVAGRHLPVWATNTVGTIHPFLIAQLDGNVCLYGANGRAAWATDTIRAKSPVLRIGDDGNLVVYAAGNRAVWSSDTAQTSGVARRPLGAAALHSNIIGGGTGLDSPRASNQYIQFEDEAAYPGTGVRQHASATMFSNGDCSVVIRTFEITKFRGGSGTVTLLGLDAGNHELWSQSWTHGAGARIGDNSDITVTERYVVPEEMRSATAYVRLRFAPAGDLLGGILKAYHVVLGIYTDYKNATGSGSGGTKPTTNPGTTPTPAPVNTPDPGTTPPVTPDPSVTTALRVPRPHALLKPWTLKRKQ